MPTNTIIPQNQKPSKCQELIIIREVLLHKRFTLQKKLRKKNYKKRGLIVFKKYLTMRQYLILRYFYAKFVKYHKIRGNRILKDFIKFFLKLDCYNIFYRDYHLGVKSVVKYKKLGEKSFFSYDKRYVLDTVVVDIILKKGGKVK